MSTDPLMGEFSSSGDPENPAGDKPGEFMRRCSEELHRACSEGKWKDVEKIMSKAPNHNTEEFVMTKILAETGDTALMAAAKGGQGLKFVEKLVEKMGDPPQGLDVKQRATGNTALHFVAMYANVAVANLLVDKCPSLLTLPNKQELIPLHLAANHGRKDMTLDLISKYSFENDEAVITLLFHLAKGRFYGLILYVIEQEVKRTNKTEKAYIHDLSVLMKDGKENFFNAIAEDTSVFRSGMQLNILENLIFSYVPKIPPEDQRDNIINPDSRSVCVLWIWKVAQVLVPSVKRIHDKKLRHHQAVDLVRQICLRVGDSDTTKQALFEKAFPQGIKNGVHEFVGVILKNYVDAINFIDVEQRSVFHLAAMYRHEEVFKILHRKVNVWEYSKWHDIQKNNVLHSVAYTAHQDRLDLETKGVLQTQRELQWFMEVKTFVKSRNFVEETECKTALEIFIKEHDEMAKREKQRMKEMATASMVASGLIASAAFGAIISGPGGNDSDGFPIFSKEPSFIVFSIASILAFLLALDSIISFISVYTSRYGYRDFLQTLPSRMIFGLIFLLLSVCTLMIAFSAAVFLVIAKQNVVFLVPIIALASVPVIFCATSQLPTLLNMISTTYRPVKLTD